MVAFSKKNSLEKVWSAVNFTVLNWRYRKIQFCFQCTVCVPLKISVRSSTLNILECCVIELCYLFSHG